MEWNCTAGDGIHCALGIPVHTHATGSLHYFYYTNLRVNSRWVRRG